MLQREAANAADRIGICCQQPRGDVLNSLPLGRISGHQHPRLIVIRNENQVRGIAGCFQLIDDQRAKACDRFRRGALRDVQDLEVSGLSGGCGIELCDDLLSGLKILGLAGNHQCSGLGIHTKGHAGGESARGVQLGQRIGESGGDLSRLGVGQAENSGIAGTLIGGIEIENQSGNLFEVVGSARNDEAVALGVDADDGLLGGRNGLGLEGIFVQRTNRACQFSGLTLCQIQHPGFTRCRG